jgi:hypothetical protein
MAAAPTMARNAWASMVFSADPAGAALVAVVVGDTGSVVEEQLARTTATHTASKTVRITDANPPHLLKSVFDLIGTA